MAKFVCTCVHQDQDRMNGKNVRVFNMGKTSYRCTVCGATKPLLGTEKKDIKKNEK